MKLFLDTSSLLKLYHREVGTEELEIIFQNRSVTEIFLSEITKVEFTSAIWKKARTKEIKSSVAAQKMMLFEKDFSKYTFITTESSILEDAKYLFLKYWQLGLRTLDSIQLATCRKLFKQADLFLTSDNLLKNLLQAEGLPTEIPNL